MEVARTEEKMGRKEKKVDFKTRIYQVVSRIPQGQVATYGQVAALAGYPLAARAAGYALHCCGQKIPCHRAVNFKGRLAPSYGKGGFKEQKKKLLKEGIVFKSQVLVDLKKHHWSGI